MFEPKFDIFSPNRTFSSLQTAILINLPHEPKATLQTREAIDLVAQKENTISEYLIRGVHQHICHWVKPNGVYRRCPVKIGGEIKDFWNVAIQMADLHPYIITVLDDLKEWYRLFQEIHPFEDGNGRVAGAIIAGISINMFGIYLIPKQ